MSDTSLFSHLLELRKRLLRAVAAIVLVFVALAPFAQELYTLLADPLLRNLPAGASMIATDVAAPFFTPFKLTLVLAFMLAVPLWLWQLWAFIAPGLYQREKRLMAPLLVGSTLLFYAGVAFAYFVVLPVVLGFFTAMAPEGVQVATDISRYLDFVLAIFVAFGIAFEVPILIILLCWSGLTSVSALRQKRPYVIVAAFVIGMMLTPPDVISQTLLAVPMCLLFELGLVVASLYTRTDADSGSHEQQN